ncbi:hypothetical protein IWX47DRAFT_853504 [Phyllosticta citricarpa]
MVICHCLGVELAPVLVPSSSSAWCCSRPHRSTATQHFKGLCLSPSTRHILSILAAHHDVLMNCHEQHHTR